VDAHRVEILDRADDDALVLVVAHDLHLVFLPAEEALFDEHLVNGRKVQAVGHNGLKFFLVIRDAAALAAQSKGGADDKRIGTDQLGRGTGLIHRVHGAGLRTVEADLDHGLLEQLAILALGNRLRLGADHFHAVFREDTGLVKIHRQVKRRLAAEGRQQRRRPFRSDDLLQNIDGERLDVGHIGKLRVRHDRGRVRIHQDHTVTLLAKGLAGLCARVIKLASLTDDNRAGANDEDGLQIGAFGHGRRFRRGLSASGDGASGKGGEIKLPARSSCEKAT